MHVSGLTQVGRPFAALVDASRTADLMVVGTRGHGRLRSVVEQSVSASVAAHAHCPVVIVRGQGDVRIGPAHPVVVGVDGSAASQAALDHAAAVARDSSAPLTVVCAWNDVARHATWVGVDTRVVIERDGMLGAERRAARAILDAAVARVRAAYPQMGVTASLVEAAPAAALLRAAADAGLVVVGTRGHGAVGRLLSGSVSQVVVRASARPAAVVRAEVAARVRDATVAAPPVTAPD